MRFLYLIFPLLFLTILGCTPVESVLLSELEVNHESSTNGSGEVTSEIILNGISNFYLTLGSAGISDPTISRSTLFGYGDGLGNSLQVYVHPSQLHTLNGEFDVIGISYYQSPQYNRVFITFRSGGLTYLANPGGSVKVSSTFNEPVDGIFETIRQTVILSDVTFSIGGGPYPMNNPIKIDGTLSADIPNMTRFQRGA